MIHIHPDGTRRRAPPSTAELVRSRYRLRQVKAAQRHSDMVERREVRRGGSLRVTILHTASVARSASIDERADQDVRGTPAIRSASSSPSRSASGARSIQRMGRMLRNPRTMGGSPVSPDPGFLLQGDQRRSFLTGQAHGTLSRGRIVDADRLGAGFSSVGPLGRDLRAISTSRFRRSPSRHPQGILVTIPRTVVARASNTSGFGRGHGGKDGPG